MIRRTTPTTASASAASTASGAADAEHAAVAGGANPSGPVGGSGALSAGSESGALSAGGEAGALSAGGEAGALSAGGEFGASVALEGLAQVDVVGGTAPTAVAAILVFFFAVALSVVVTYRYANGYLRTRERPLLYLTVGLLLLAPAPMFVRLFLGNVAVVTATERALVVTLSKLLGLLVILSVVYRT